MRTEEEHRARRTDCVENSTDLERRALERMLKSYDDTPWGPALRARLATLKEMPNRDS